jgi:hypothetical protein
MFQASRNWSNISSIVNVMIDHLARLPHLGRDVSRNSIKLIDERGELIENYDIIFKELFCAAARALADKTKSNLTQVGMLWDEILPTGTGGEIHRRQPSSRRSHPSNASDDAIAMEKGEIQQPKVQELYRGSLMFLVRRVESPRELLDLEAAGYRFADPHQVSGIISSSMQIKSGNFANRLANMAAYAQEDSTRLSPGVHLAFFAVRARVGSHGFDILVRKTARHLLPSVEMPVDRLEPWQLNFLRQLDGFTPERMMKTLESRKNPSAQDFFSSQLLTSLEQLREQVGDDIFEEATLTAKVVQIPCRPGTATSSSQSASLITFKVVIPIHCAVRSKNLEFVPMSLFKVHQLAYKDSPHNLIFSRSVHREISPILNTIPIVVDTKTTTSKTAARLSAGPTRLQRLTAALFRRQPTPSRGRLPHTTVDADGNPIPTVYGRRESNHSSSTLKLWNPASTASRDPRDGSSSGARRPGERSNSWQQDQGSEDTTTINDTTPKGSSTFDVVERYTSATSPGGGTTSSDVARPLSPTTPFAHHMLPQNGSVFGGIMVSQEITVNVAEAGFPGAAGVPEMGQRVTHVAAPGDRRHSAAGRPEKSGAGRAIELQPLGNKAGVTVQPESAGEAMTFVDELFAVCVEWR